MDAIEKKCQFCAEVIKIDAVRCRHCQADLLPQKAPPPELAKPASMAWLWVGIPVGVVVIFFAIGALSGPPTEKDRARVAIDLCWEPVDDALTEIGVRRFVRTVCQKMTADFETKYGYSPSLRRN